jgi:hypothetical protein
MAEPVVLLGLFKSADPAANALDKLREMGIRESDITIISGVPYSAHVLARPMVWERLPVIAISGASVGLLIGLFLTAGTPLLYGVRVGGHPLIPVPPSLIIIYEFTMMGLLVSTFLGVLWESVFPSFGPKYYDAAIADGRIGVLLRCWPPQESEARNILAAEGAERIQKPERRLL